MDELGRIVIPGDIRKALGWETSTKLEVISDSYLKSVTIWEAFPRCTLCRKETENLVKVAQGYICPQCVAKVR